MADRKYCIFQVQGGLGKHIAATAVAQAIKNNHPDRELIVVCGWPELWASLPFVHRVYTLGQTQYFFQEYVDGVDSLIFSNEPYLTTDHVHKRLPLIQTWCKMYGVEYAGEKPVIRINPEQRRLIRNFYKFDKPPLLIHTNGGMYASDKPYRWARDIPIRVAEEIAKHYGPTHQIIQVTRQTSPKITYPGTAILEGLISNTELMGILEICDKRVLIDSSLQHGAAALGLRSTVLWNATSPEVFGYDIHDNIKAKEKPKINLPGSYLFDYDFDGNEMEYPYDESDEKDLFDMDLIFASIDRQGGDTAGNAKGFK